MNQLCAGCKTFRDIVYQDEAERLFCAECASFFPESQAQFLMEFLASTIPYQVGDKVSCYSGNEVYDGIGHIIEVSFDPKDLASPVIPMFKVEIDERAYPEMPDTMFYPEICLRLVEKADA